PIHPAVVFVQSLARSGGLRHTTNGQQPKPNQEDGMPLFVRPRRKERRRRFVYVTRNTEYHVMDGICVAVRDRRSRTWRDDHPAVGHNLAGGIRIVGGAMLPSLEGPALDEPIYFVD